MAAEVTVQTHDEGIAELLKSDGVLRMLEGKAANVAAAAGPGMEYEASVGQTRARAMVWTETFEAMRAEAISRSLTRAIDAARG